MSLKPGQGHAIFTAECSHSFHFHCITSNVKHGNHICPICRAKWKEIPFQSPLSSKTRTRLNTSSSPPSDPWTPVVRPHPHGDDNRHISSVFHSPEPSVFDDDELTDPQPELIDDTGTDSSYSFTAIEMKTSPEISAVSNSVSHENFTILVHLKALKGRSSNGVDEVNLLSTLQYSRAPVDIVTVLDVSGSMAGTTF